MGEEVIFGVACCHPGPGGLFCVNATGRNTAGDGVGCPEFVVETGV